MRIISARDYNHMSRQAANIISANVPYGKLEEIAKVPGVQDVVLEMQ